MPSPKRDSDDTLALHGAGTNLSSVHRERTAVDVRAWAWRYPTAAGQVGGEYTGHGKAKSCRIVREIWHLEQESEMVFSS